MKNFEFKVEEILVDIFNKDTISLEQITKLKSFFSQNDVKNNMKIIFNLFKPRKRTKIDIEPSTPHYYE